MSNDNKQGMNNTNKAKAEDHAVETHIARPENAPDLSERILDKEEAEEIPVEEKSKAIKETLKMEKEEDSRRDDNKEHSDRILDREVEDDDAPAAPGAGSKE